MKKAITFLTIIAVVVTSCSKKNNTPVTQQNSGDTTAGTSPIKTLQVIGRHLTDTNGNIILLRGVNVAFYGGNNSGGTYQNVNPATMSSIASVVHANATKCNAVRLLWLSQTVGGSQYSLSNLESLITAYTNLNLIPVIYL
ncbi:MAG TPA: hypothetical protein VK705_09340 [Ferruginibacter sp.]|jgi:hypothetical protein|nr:hypothetical protein [Ferruginibacter sp.]